MLTALSAHIRELCLQRERVIEVRVVALPAKLVSLWPSRCGKVLELGRLIPMALNTELVEATLRAFVVLL